MNTRRAKEDLMVLMIIIIQGSYDDPAQLTFSQLFPVLRTPPLSPTLSPLFNAFFKDQKR